MLYGKPTKHIRHVDEDTLTIEPQRFQIHLFWKYGSNATSRTDGLDLNDSKVCPLGSKITKHKVDMLVTPETIEPQQIYMGRLKLSFSDCMHQSHCGGHFSQASFGDEATEVFTAKTNPICTTVYPDDAEIATPLIRPSSPATGTNTEIGGSGSGKGIKDWMLDDHIKSVINVKKITVFDQRPLMGERWQRIPSKVKRINEGTFYGLWIFNDSPRGATPADTQVTVNIKSYWEEMAL